MSASIYAKRYVFVCRHVYMCYVLMSVLDLCNAILALTLCRLNDHNNMILLILDYSIRYV